MLTKLTRPSGVLLIGLLLSLAFIPAAAQPPGCPLGQGYWKTQAAWPVTELTLGGQTYNQAELLILLNTESSDDASLILAHQLIAAKLNVANGADVTAISGIVAQADALLATYAGKLPYAIAPSSAEGQALANWAGVLDVYNQGQLTVGCVTVATPTLVPDITPEATPADDDLPITLVIEGPVQQININIITIYNINIEVNINDPILNVIQIGDIVRVEGGIRDSGDTIIIVAVNIIVVDVDVVIIDGDLIWRDDGSCLNAPPPWAPANGWRRRCEGGERPGRGDDDDDDDD
ncbi:MAG: hypothetical protein BroJett038_28730 [Chloroflexota bacterium]|nr:MAG: hypothetical protein BroJett038_28730 [Chloroflexota bacterium]